MNETFILKPPSMIEVVYRCMVLRAAMIRWHLEIQGCMQRTKSYMRKLKAALAVLLPWVTEQNLYAHMSKGEQALFQKPLSQWSTKDLNDGLHWNEALGTLLWGAALIDEYPACEEGFPAPELAYETPELNDVGELMDLVGMRSRRELVLAADLTWGYLKRAGLLLRYRGGHFSLEQYREFISDLIWELKSAGIDPETQGGDLPFRRRPFERISKDDADDMLRRCEQRLKTLGWLR